MDVLYHRLDSANDGLTICSFGLLHMRQSYSTWPRRYVHESRTRKLRGCFLSSELFSVRSRLGANRRCTGKVTWWTSSRTRRGRIRRKVDATDRERTRDSRQFCPRRDVSRNIVHRQIKRKNAASMNHRFGENGAFSAISFLIVPFQLGGVGDDRPVDSI